MTVDSHTKPISDGLNKLPAAPDEFGSFYRKLLGLRFPLAVADILELRYVFNHAIDQTAEPAPTPDYRHFCDERRREMDRIGIDQPHHAQRLLKLLAVLRQLHLGHSIHSRDTEAELRRALVNNRRAAQQSRRYGNIAFAALAAIASFWLVLYQPAWWLYAGVAVTGYFALDYFYSLSILKKEYKLLGRQLEELLARRVAALNWSGVVRNIALVLGYAKLSGVEAFVLHEDEIEDVHRYYL